MGYTDIKTEYSFDYEGKCYVDVVVDEDSGLTAIELEITGHDDHVRHTVKRCLEADANELFNKVVMVFYNKTILKKCERLVQEDEQLMTAFNNGRLKLARLYEFAGALNVE